MLRLDLVLLSLGSILLLQILIAWNNSKIRHVPGPWYTVFSGFPLKLSTLSGRKIFYIDYLHRKYGKIVRISPDTVAVADVESISKIHKIGSGFQKTKWYSDVTPGDRDGIFAIPDAKVHSFRRKLLSKAFSKTNLRTHWEQTVISKVELTIKGIQNEVLKSGEADILKWFTFMATDVSGHLMFGESFNILELGKKIRYMEVMEKYVVSNALGAELPLLLPILKLIPFKAVQDLFNGHDLIASYAKRAVSNAKKAGTKANIFADMIEEAESGNGMIDLIDVQREAGNLTVAGTDTTAISLTYLVWLVLQKGQLRSALEEEIRRLPDGFLDADLETLPLLNATVQEALRLYGAVSGDLPRSVPTGGTDLAGIFIPGGVTVTTQSWTVHRDPQLFENPELFDPYRFLNGQKDPSSSLPSTATERAMFPFGLGPRICLGIHLANMVLRYNLVYFLRECQSMKLAPSTTAKSMEPENFFVIAPKSHKCMVTSRS